MEIIKGQKYKHYKNGKTYAILEVGKHSETLEDMVVYQGLYTDTEFGNNPIWIRPLNIFISKVIVDGKETSRFTLLS